jgi:glycosyltransferase involved in cell wall biosynthesis
MSNRLQNKIAPAYGHKFKVIYNGYDADDSSKSTVLKPNNTLVLSHLGTLVKDRNPEVLWETIADLKRQDTQLSSKLKIQCIGKTDAFIKERIRVHGIEDVVQFESYKPHNEILALQQQSDVLILIINNTPHAQDTITGKVFEYMHAQKPILCIGPQDGEAAALLTDTQTGITVGYSDNQQLKTVIQHWLKKRPAATHTDISRFSRKVQVDDLLAWLKQMPLGAKQFH